MSDIVLYIGTGVASVAILSALVAKAYGAFYLQLRGFFWRWLAIIVRPFSANCYLRLFDASSPLYKRLQEVRDCLSQQEAVVRSTRVIHLSLQVGQYVVGGLLATSFVQESLPRQAVGALGVLVLLSSLIYQRFRPDLQLVTAAERVFRLKALIRSIEDRLNAKADGAPRVPSTHATLMMISKRLSEIERLELNDLRRHISATTENNNEA